MRKWLIEGWMDGEGSDWMMDVYANGKYQRGNHFLQNIDLPKKTKLRIGCILDGLKLLIFLKWRACVT